MNNFQKIITGICFLTLASCTNSNRTENAVFLKYPSTSEIYKKELSRQLTMNGTDAFTVTFQKYVSIENKDYIELTFKSDDMEAIGLVLVKNWNKIEVLKSTGGYRGAELKNLKLAFVSDQSSNLLYKDLSEIID